MKTTLAVVGAINVDLVISGAPLPAPGEAVVGGTFSRHQGGKGGNQAVAAARAIGRATGEPRVVMVGAVGGDDLGRSALAALTEEGIATYVYEAAGAPTGVALIAVDAGGENQISVAPGANDLLTDKMVVSALVNYSPAVVLASLEVPEAAVRAAAEWCWASDVPFVMNPAPARAWARGLLGLCSFITPNQGELGALGDPPDELTIVETLGAHGARIHRQSATTDIDADAVDAVDATGAGDCFNGVFAAGLLDGLDVEAAVRRAVRAAMLSVTVAGAREGMPTRDLLD